MDIATRELFPKEQLLRFILKDGDIVLDESWTLQGRGVYLKKSKSSLELALKKRCFERAFHRPLGERLLTHLQEILQ